MSLHHTNRCRPPDYLFGAGDEAISKSDVIKLITLYLFG